MKIEAIWNEQENDLSVPAGLLRRRYAGSVLPDIFVSLRHPEKVRGLAVRISNTIRVDIPVHEQLKDLRIEVIPDEYHAGKSLLLILLSGRQHADIFSVLCEDLINAVAQLTDEYKVVKELLNRLEEWKSLFDQASLQGLTPTGQRGLYGELYFLRKWIRHSLNLNYCIQSWAGPEKAVRDFQYGEWALEVKTTHGNNHQKVMISSERQLDTKNLSSLFLFHLSLEVQQANGETLNEITSAISDLLSTDIAAQSRFRAKLLEAGYFRHHQHLYNETGYQVRQEAIYDIRNDFPRLEEQSIPHGVGDVKYSIILSDFSNYIIEDACVFAIINSTNSHE